MNDICHDICPCNDCSTEEDECVMAKAYKKQIPKIHAGTGNCPTCGQYTTEDDYGNMDYCYNCGQAIDWEGV